MPDVRIFVDGRSDTVYPDEITRDWARFVAAEGDWRRIPRDYDAQVLFLRSSHAVVPWLEGSTEWVRAYGDATCVVYLRTDVPETAALVERARTGRIAPPRVGPEDNLLR
jgi:hypothetical protein